jgi:hypothetical protein
MRATPREARDGERKVNAAFGHTFGRLQRSILQRTWVTHLLLCSHGSRPSTLQSPWLIK